MRRLAGEHVSATVYVAGEVVDARRLLRKFCDEGLCVTVAPTTFIYTRGAEEGVAVGLANYPRFPRTRTQVQSKAEEVCQYLIEGLSQGSGLVVGPLRNMWFTDRQEDN